jgi:hypothetical protein
VHLQVVDSAAKCLRPNGNFCSFSPCIEQVQRTAQALRERDFTDVCCKECLLRHYAVKSEPKLVPVIPQHLSGVALPRLQGSPVSCKVVTAYEGGLHSVVEGLVDRGEGQNQVHLVGNRLGCSLHNTTGEMEMALGTQGQQVQDLGLEASGRDARAARSDEVCDALDGAEKEADLQGMCAGALDASKADEAGEAALLCVPGGQHEDALLLGNVSLSGGPDCAIRDAVKSRRSCIATAANAVLAQNASPVSVDMECRAGEDASHTSAAGEVVAGGVATGAVVDGGSGVSAKLQDVGPCNEGKGVDAAAEGQEGEAVGRKRGRCGEAERLVRSGVAEGAAAPRRLVAAPVMNAKGHTGYLLFARKLVPADC